MTKVFFIPSDFYIVMVTRVDIPDIYDIYKRIAPAEQRGQKYTLPMGEPNNGLILNPEKFKDQIKDEVISIDEIKILLLMMLSGISQIPEELITRDKGELVNIAA